MEKNVKRILVGIVIVVSSLCSQCKTGSQNPDPAPCVAETSSESSLLDTYLSSNGQLIAIFNFSQDVKSFADLNCGQTSYGATSLSITNPTSQPISFNYAITVTVGVVTWQYQNAVAIAAHSTVNVGVINSVNQQRIHIGTFNIQLFNIT